MSKVADTNPDSKRRHYYMKLAHAFIDTTMRTLTRTEAFVYLALARHCPFTGAATCWPSVEQLAEMAGCRVRQAQRALRHLEARGLIQTVMSGGKIGRAHV